MSVRSVSFIFVHGVGLRIWEESDRRFGPRFVKCFLPDEFSGATLYRVRKCVCELGIKGCASYRSKRMATPDKNANPWPDPVRRDFTNSIPAYKLGRCLIRALGIGFRRS